MLCWNWNMYWTFQAVYYYIRGVSYLADVCQTEAFFDGLELSWLHAAYNLWWSVGWSECLSPLSLSDLDNVLILPEWSRIFIEEISDHSTECYRRCSNESGQTQTQTNLQTIHQSLPSEHLMRGAPMTYYLKPYHDPGNLALLSTQRWRHSWALWRHKKGRISSGSQQAGEGAGSM